MVRASTTIRFAPRGAPQAPLHSRRSMMADALSELTEAINAFRPSVTGLVTAFLPAPLILVGVSA